MRTAFAALTCSALLLIAPGARALPIVVRDAERGVGGEVTASRGDVDYDEALDERFDEGPAVLAALATADDGGPTAVGEGRQTSELSAAALTGVGDATASADAPLLGDLAIADAGSLYEVVFVATADALLSLTGSIAASTGMGVGDAFAFVELVSLDHGLDPLLLQFAVGRGEELAIDALAPLVAGISYRLTAVARSGADPLGGETGAVFAAHFDFALSDVPEPGGLALVAFGLALLAPRRMRSILRR